MLRDISTKGKPPYQIPVLPNLDADTISSLDKRHIRKTIRIEGLLRSPLVWELYHQAVRRTSRCRSAPPITDPELWMYLYSGNRLKLRGAADAQMRRLLWDDSLQKRFHVDDGWAVLLGSHHRYLRPQHVSFRIGEGIVNLAVLHQTKDLSFSLKLLEENQSRYLYVMIDSLEVSSSDLTRLKCLLRNRQSAMLAEDRYCRPYPANKYDAWKKHLSYHDKHRYEQASPAQIGKSLYGMEAPRARMSEADRVTASRQSATMKKAVNRACSNVDQLIKHALKGPWSPSPL